MLNRIDKNNFTLVLSGGGALGIAHLGVLHDMEACSYRPQEIVGTSMGAIIGSCLAIGMREQEIYAQIQKFTGIFNWMKFSVSGNAMIENEKIGKIFEGLFEGRKMHETEIALKLIATDLLNGHKRVFDANDDVSIKDAVLASMAIPGIFEEQTIDGRVYGDGFLCENLGIMQADCTDVLAVDVQGKNAFHKTMPDSFFKTANMMEMFEKSMRLLIFNQTQANLACSKKNILLIEPETKHFKSYHFHKHKEIRAVGLGLL